MTLRETNTYAKLNDDNTYDAIFPEPGLIPNSIDEKQYSLIN